MFGRATIRLGIGPHSSFLCNMPCFMMTDCARYGRPMEYDRPLYFHAVVSIYLFFFSPRLISVAAYWMSTILPHMVWP